MRIGAGADVGGRRVAPGVRRTVCDTTSDTFSGGRRVAPGVRRAEGGNLVFPGRLRGLLTSGQWRQGLAVVADAAGGAFVSRRRDAETMREVFGEAIYAYSREQAIEDGELVDVSETAQEAGFRFPVVLTRAAWADCVEWSEEDSRRQTYQDEAGRLWDVVWMASRAARRGGESILFQLYRVPRGGRGVRPRLVTLKMVCGPGDEGEPVITIMLPGED